VLDRQVLYTSQHAGLSNPHFSGAEKRRIQTRTASKIKIPFPAAREKKEACWWCVGLFLVQLNFNKRILSLTLQILLSIITFIKLWLLKYYWCINFIWHKKCFLQHVSSPLWSDFFPSKITILYCSQAVLKNLKVSFWCLRRGEKISANV